MNWLATIISSLRDYYDAQRPYTPEGLYTAAPPPYTTRSVLTQRLRRLALLFVKKFKRFSYFTYFYSRVPIKLLILQRLCNNAWPARSITRGPAAHLKT